MLPDKIEHCIMFMNYWDVSGVFWSFSKCNIKIPHLPADPSSGVWGRVIYRLYDIRLRGVPCSRPGACPVFYHGARSPPEGAADTCGVECVKVDNVWIRSVFILRYNDI